MKYFLVILLAIASSCAKPPEGRIYGGEEATSDQFPFIVAINDEFGQYCDGTIIAPGWILTAAQCLHNILPSAEVYVGSHLNLVNGTAYKIAETILHEGYNDSTYQNDIGLIKIDGVLTYSETVQQIKLGEPTGTNAVCTALGWGSTVFEDFPEILNYVALTVLEMEACENVSADYLDGYYLGVEQLCTAGSASKGICSGDAGGPLVCDGKLAGIISYRVGYECGDRLPAVYSRTGAYAEWIQMHIEAKTK